MCRQVLLACVKCPGGRLLSHENILSIFQACFRIGHYQTERSKDMSGASPLFWLVTPLRHRVMTASNMIPPANLVGPTTIHNMSTVVVIFI
jgi:hypothetical protein